MRLFDTYISDEEGFSTFHTHICATLFLIWSNKLKSMQFMDIMIFLQSLNQVNKEWSEADIEMLIAEAYVYKSLYQSSVHMKQ